MFKLVDVSVTFEGVRYIRKALVYEPLEKVLEYPYAWACQKNKEPSAHTTALKRMRRFLEYLATREDKPFDEKGLVEFWLYVTAQDIQAWKQFRVDQRLLTGKGADYNSIDEEAKTITLFFYWLSEEQGLRLLYNPEKKIESAESLSKHSRYRAKRGQAVVDHSQTDIPSPDASGLEGYDEDDDDHIHVSDKALPNDNKYLTGEQLTALQESFSDIVYPMICAAAIHTGLRNFEMLGVPVFTPGMAFTCDPVLLEQKLKEAPGKKNVEMTLPVKGKFSNERDIPIDVETWLDIMRIWWPVYRNRRNRYKEEYGKPLPAGCLWITKSLVPLFCHPEMKSTHEKPLETMRNAFKYVSRTKKESLAKNHGFTAHYYKLRYTFATRYMYELIKASPSHDKSYWIDHKVHKENLSKRMGHKSINTTWEHYIDSTFLAYAEIEEGASLGSWFPDQGKYLEELYSKRQGSHNSDA